MLSSDKLDSEIIVQEKSNPPNVVCFLNGTILLNEERNLISFGRNERHILGQTNIHIYPPQQIPNLMNIKMIDCGKHHTACIDFEGNLYTFGCNYNGQLGVGKSYEELPSSHVPQHITDIPPIDYISCGYNFTVCISNDRNAYSFGIIRGNHNQMKNKLHCSPQLIPGVNDIEFIVCGSKHVVFKLNSNKYYSWGENYYGQFVQELGNFGISVNPSKINNWPKNIVDIKCGEHHTLLLTSKGIVYSVGFNYKGGLGLHENIKKISKPALIKDIPIIKRIECGTYHSMCIDINDRLWVFGDNEYGQLGLGNKKENRYTPTLNESLHDIIDVATINTHSFVKTIHNEIYGFGVNYCCQLGLESKHSRNIPEQVFKGEKVWPSNEFISKQKSARN